jgi:hypothetical protein
VLEIIHYFRLSWWLGVHVNSVLGWPHNTKIDNAAAVSEIRASSISGVTSVWCVSMHTRIQVGGGGTHTHTHTHRGNKNGDCCFV